MRYLSRYSLLISAHYNSMLLFHRECVNFDAVSIITGEMYGIFVGCVLTNQGSLVLVGLLHFFSISNIHDTVTYVF